MDKLLNHLIDPDKITSTTIVENYVYAYDPKSKVIWIFHSELPFRLFVRFMDTLIDNFYEDIKEISKKDYLNFAITTKSSCLHITPGSLNDSLKKISK